MAEAAIFAARKQPLFIPVPKVHDDGPDAVNAVECEQYEDEDIDDGLTVEAQAPNPASCPVRMRK